MKQTDFHPIDTIASGLMIWRISDVLLIEEPEWKLGLILKLQNKLNPFLVLFDPELLNIVEPIKLTNYQPVICVLFEDNQTFKRNPDNSADIFPNKNIFGSINLALQKFDPSSIVVNVRILEGLTIIITG